MNPEEFRAAGHQSDRLDRRLSRARRRPAGHGARPSRARSRRSCRPRRPTRRSRSTRSCATSIASSCPACRTGSTRASSATSRATAIARQRARRLRQHRPRRARPGVAVEPGADRGRGSRHRLAAADGRPVRRPGAASSRTRPRRSTLVALLCARERTTDYSLAPRRPAGGAGAARRLHVGAQPQLGRQGRAARRLRPRERARSCRTTTQYAMRPDALDAAIAADRRGRPHAVRRRRDDRHDDDHGARSDRGDRRRSPREHGLWLHVDAAMAGSAMILPECRWMWDGVERADSLVAQSAQVARRRVRLLASTTSATPSTSCA